MGLSLTRLLAWAAAVVALAFVVPAAATAQGEPGGTAGSPAPPTDAPESVPAIDLRNRVPSAAQFQKAATAAQSEDGVNMIVGLKVDFRPEALRSSNEARAQESEIAARRTELVAALKGTDYDVYRTYDQLPYVAVNLSPGAVRALQRSGKVASLQEDALSPPELLQSTALIQSDELATMFPSRTGLGRIVSVLDTGILKTHSFLQNAGGGSKVVSEACFALGQNGPAAGGNCPGGTEFSTAFGSGEPYPAGNFGADHGTHVAGIAVGRGGPATTPRGVAPDAKLVSVKVFSIFAGAACTSIGLPTPCVLSWTSDQLAGLNRILAIQPAFPTIDSVNISIGGGMTSVDCPADVRAAPVTALRALGIATAIAAGNSGAANGVSFPACIPTAITVGATTDVAPESVANYSNSSPLIELLAPGSNITSSVPSGGFAPKNGTSMAAPHVAGAWAVLKQTSPRASVDTLLSQLQLTGKPVTVTRGAFTVTKPNIRLLPASARIAQTGLYPAANWALPGGGVASNGAGLATRAGGPAAGVIRLRGIPGGSLVQAVYLYWQTYGGPDASVLLNGVPRVGQVVGISADTCWSAGNVKPIRTYRALLPAGAAPANANYSIAGVGGVNGADAQGASLVVVYARAGDPVARTHILHGAATLNTAGASYTANFAGISLPAAGADFAYLNNGVGDGQAFTEDPLLFAGSPVSLPNWVSGSDGAMWDDRRFSVSPSLLPLGTVFRPITLSTAGDCLSWAYSSLTYE